MKIHSALYLSCKAFWAMLWETQCSSVIFGVLGLIVVLLILIYFIFFPLRRDVRLVRKNYWVWVGIFMLATAATLQFWGLIYSYVGPPSARASVPWKMLLFFFGSSVDPSHLSEVGLSYMLMTLIKIFVVNGILVATIVGLFNRRIHHYNTGEIRYLPFVFWCLRNRYAVVIGSNEVTASIIKNLLRSCQHKQAAHELDCYCDRKLDYILLQTNRKASEVRTLLESQLSDEELNRVIIYTAYRDSEKDLEKLYLQYAYSIYILGEQTVFGEPETFHDTMNMKCLNMVAQHLKRFKPKNAPKKLKECRVMFEYQTTHSVFQFSDVSEEVKETVEFIPFNRYECWARKVLVDNVSDEGNGAHKIEYIPLDGYDGIKYDSNQHVHFVVIGMSKMGIAMGIQAMLQAHYPNYVRDSNLKTRITFIDTHADKEKNFFMGRFDMLFQLTRHRYVDANNCKVEYLNTQEECGDVSDSLGYKWIDPMTSSSCQWKHLSRDGRNFMDLEIEFIKGEIESPNVRQYLSEIAQEENSKLTLAICLTNAHQAIAASLYLPTEVYTSEQLQQILVYQRQASDIIDTISTSASPDLRYEKLRSFGMVYRNYMSDRTDYLKSMLVNAIYDMDGIDDDGVAYHAHDIDFNKNNAFQVIKNLWRELPVSLIWSNKHFDDTIYQKLRSVLPYTKNNRDSVGGYKSAMYNNPKLYNELSMAIEAHELQTENSLARCEHNRWTVQQLILGYSPCQLKLFNEFKQLNAVAQANEQELKHWKELVGWRQLSPTKRTRAKEQEDYKSLSKGKFDTRKKEEKFGKHHRHPNICAYEILDDVDFGAKSYDTYLNAAIPQILTLVDGYKSPAYTQWLETRKSHD